MKKIILALVFLTSMCVSVKSQTTYYWVGGNGATSATTSSAIDWIGTNWNTSADGTGTARVASAGNDILIFDGNSPKLTPGNKSIFLRNVPTDSCGQLQIINGAAVFVQSVFASNIALTGYTTSGSNILELTTVNQNNYSLLAGQPITGNGIPTGTTISSVSTPINFSASGATTTLGSTTITLTLGNSNIVPGLIASGTGITANSAVVSATTPTVININGSTSTSTSIALSKENIALLQSIQVGMGISGSGIPAGATITNFDGDSTITISLATTTAVTATPLIIASPQTVTLSYPATATTAASSFVTITFASQTITLSQNATSSTTTGSPISFTANPNFGVGAGTIAQGTVYGGATIPVTGTGASFTSFFRPGDYIMTGNNYGTLAEVLSVTTDNNMTIANDGVTPLATGAYYKATALYIKGSAGLTIDAESSLNLGNTAGNFLNGFIVSIQPGSKATIYGTVNFVSRGTGARLIGVSPGSVVFKAGSNLTFNVSLGGKTMLLGTTLGTGSASSGTFAFNTTGASIIFEAGANFTHITTSGTPFGAGYLASSPLTTSLVTAFQPNSNYNNRGAGYPPYFYSNNVNFGNLIWDNASGAPSNSSGNAISFNPARVDTFNIKNMITNTTINSGRILLYGDFINNSSTTINFGTMVFADTTKVQKISGTNASDRINNLWVRNNVGLTILRNIRVAISVNVMGKIDLGTYTITGPTTASTFTNNIASTRTFNQTTGVTATLNSTGFTVTNIATIPLFSTITSSSHPNIFPEGTYVVSYNNGGNYTASSPATISARSTTTPPLSLTFTTKEGTIITANAGGLNASIPSFVTYTLNTNNNYSFNGSVAQVTGALLPTSVNNLAINNPAGVTLTNTSTSIIGNLSLTSGNLAVNTNKSLTLKTGATLTGGSASSFIDTKVDVATGGKGVFAIEGFASERTFPVGTNDNYLPITITPTVTSNFSVTAFNGATVDGTPNGAALSASQKDTSVDAIYFINRTVPASGSPYTLKLGYPTSLKGATFATYTNQIGISNYNGSTWSVPNGSGDNSANFATDTSSATGAFYITRNSSSTILPVKFSSVNASLLTSSSAKVTWSVGSEVNVDAYIVESSSNGVSFTAVGTVKATGSNTYNLVDNNVSGAVVYYRVKSVDKGTGAVNYSSVVSIAANAAKVASVNVYPNPVVGSELHLQTTNFKAGKLYVMLYDNLGKQIAQQAIAYNGGAMAQTLVLSNAVKAGTYQLVVTDGTSSINKNIFVVR